MKIVNLIKSVLYAILLMVLNISCVHDDDYNTAPLVCQDLTPTTTIAQLKAMYTGTTKEITSDLVLVGYVSSSDETGNIYKTLYIQDAPENPTHGLTISVDGADLYTKYPIGSKVYIKLKNLYLGQYGGVIQLGDLGIDENGASSFGRIPNVKIDGTIIKSCDPLKKIVPKEVSINQFNDNLIGALVKVKDAQFVSGVLCTTYANEGVTVNKNLEDCSGSKVIVRNSGFATFYNETLPSGKGGVVAILSKFSSDYQLYIRSTEDVKELVGTPRCDGSTFSCTPPADNASIKDLKDLYKGTLIQITNDLNVKATVTANDATNNLFKYIYVEDETGGLKVRLNKTSLYLENKFKVGSEITIKAKDLYLGNVGGEIQLGALFNGAIGNIEEADIYKSIYYNGVKNNVTPTTISINSSPNLDANIGKLIKLENVEFDDASADAPFAGTSATNRTLKDCSGKTIIVRTSNFASFASTPTPSGKGTLVGVLSVFNGVYQVWIRDLSDLNMEGNRCDGTSPPKTLFSDDFSAGLGNWNAVNVKGAQVWTTSNQGTGTNYYAVMNGFSGSAIENEDWLVSNAISLTGYTTYFLNFDSDVRYNGSPLELYVTDNYTNNPSTTTWTKLNATFDTNSGSFGFVNSGNVDLSSYAGKTIRIAYKYTSTSSAASTWEVDNLKIKARK